MRVIVTRPEPECSQWVHALAREGMQAIALPLIHIGPARDAAAVRLCWERLGDYAAVMFVSGAAVAHFFSVRPASDLGACLSATAAVPRFWAPGPGTVAALVRRGVDPVLVDAPPGDSAQFDSEALWRVVGGRIHRGHKVLIVRGGDGTDDDAPVAAGNAPGAGREWLANALTAAGAEVQLVEAYERCLPPWGPEQQALAQAAAQDGSVWLFTSSQALAHLRSCEPAQDWSQSRAIATHPRIAQAAREAGFGVVWQSRPRVADVVASIESGG